MQKNAVDGERCKKCGATEDVIEVTLELEMRSGVTKKMSSYFCWPCFMRMLDKACKRQEENENREEPHE